MKHALASVLGIVRRTVDRNALLAAGDRVLVAVSGGPDSVGLLAILTELRDRIGVELVAGHVNHRLRRDDSVADEQCAYANAGRLGVPFVRADLPSTLLARGNLEARARELRYRALHQLAADARCTKIATGHTLEDQAETVLLKLVRGAGFLGLEAIRTRREDGVIRPLIDCPRADVLAIVQQLGLPYRMDASNEDPRFQRTVIRYRVLPVLRALNPQVSRTLAAAAGQLRAVERIVRDWATAELASLSENGRLDVHRLSEVSSELRPHAVHAWLLAEGVAAAGLTSRHVEAVLRLASKGEGSGSVRLPGGVRIRRIYSHLSVEVSRPQPDEYAPMELCVGGSLCLPGGWRLHADPVAIDAHRHGLPRDLWSALCDFDAPIPLRVRAPRRGDRVRPIGLHGGRKLSDLFIDRKIPAEQRASYPVVEADGEILWVPGIVRGEPKTVTPTTRTALRLRAARPQPRGRGRA